MPPWPQSTHTARNAAKCACRTSGDAFCRYIVLSPAGTNSTPKCATPALPLTLTPTLTLTLTR